MRGRWEARVAVGLLLLVGCATTDPGRRSPKSHYEIGQALLASGDARAAIREFSKAVEGEPREPRFHFTLGQAFLLVKELELAAKALERAIDLNPRFSDARHLLGAVYLLQGKLGEAEREFLGALADPVFTQVADAYVNLAKIARKRNRLDETLTYLQKAVDISPENVLAHNDLGLLYLERRQYALAVQEFRKALQLVPDRPILLWNLGLAHFQAGDMQEARAILRRVVEVQPTGLYAEQARRLLERLQ
ncbi:MAG: tetratricopeptide repeat protein [Candidatus Methylomirabilales bacterium]